MEKEEKVLNTYEMIWELVRQIPRGKVATYGEIARLCGLVGQARLVGHALRIVPDDVKIPWHRVINGQGKISLPEARGQSRRQRRLLQQEGVVFDANKIDLDKFGWLRSLEKPLNKEREVSIVVQKGRL